MKRSFTSSVTMLSVLLAAGSAGAQRAPASPNQPWQSTLSVPAPARSVPVIVPDPGKTYTLAELVNFAEQNNPETRVAWENAKAKAADLGVSKSTLYPTVAAAVVAAAAAGKDCTGVGMPSSSSCRAPGPRSESRRRSPRIRPLQSSLGV